MGPHGAPFEWHNIWGYWWLLVIFWWWGGARLVGVAAHRLRHSRVLSRREDPALLTLRERFARGEIDRAEYEQRRAVLKGRPVTTSAAPQGGDGPSWPDLP